jgi:hypothetical protein
MHLKLWFREVEEEAVGITRRQQAAILNLRVASVPVKLEIQRRLSRDIPPKVPRITNMA